MVNYEKMKNKLEKALMREYNDLTTIQKLIERYVEKQGQKNEQPVIDAIKKDIARENKDERIFNRSLEKFEKILKKSFKKNELDENHYNNILDKINIFKKELLLSLSAGGNLEKIAKQGDINKLRQEILKDLKLDQGMYQEIEILWKEMDIELEEKKKEVSSNDLKIGRNEIFIELKELDNKILQGLYETLEKSYRMRLDEKTKVDTRNKGFIAKFVACNGPYNTNELNYVTFTRRINKGFPLKIEFECKFSTSGHKEIMGSGRGEIVNAGILYGDKTGMRFSSFSSTWTSKFAANGTALYEFGNLINDAMRKVLGIR